jgi:two-component system sensor histidine kinase AlgZ
MKDSQILSTFGPAAPQSLPKPSEPNRCCCSTPAGVVLRAVLFVETVLAWPRCTRRAASWPGSGCWAC